MRIFWLFAVFIFVVAGTPSMAQDSKVGDTAKTSSGVVGKRQERFEVATAIKPTARLSTRIQNRVQNRIRNRIDRYYDPQANAASPFEVASEKTQNSTRTKPK